MIKLWRKQKILLLHIKTINRFFLTLLILLHSFTILETQTTTRISKVYAFTQSMGECCIETSTNEVLFEHNSHQKLPMASTTKIITAITVLENASLDETVEITDSCEGIEGSSIYLKKGEKYTVEDLLYGLMLRSGNDAAIALALHIGKNTDDFCQIMNNLCKKIGATNTNVCNPHGLNEENHYTTAEDLAKITVYALKNTTFKQIVSTQKKVVTEIISGNTRCFVNKNKLLYRDKRCYGVKTGYTKKAGRCLVSSFQGNDFDVVCVVLNSPQMYERSQEIAQSCFDKYACKIIIGKKSFEDAFSIGDLKTLTIDGDLKEIKLNNCKTESYEVRIDFNNLNKNTKKGGILGKIDIFSQNQLIYSKKIYTLLDIKDERLIQVIKEKARDYQRCINNENK